nr:MAG: pseudouridine synthase [Thermoproteus sp. AZ2]
MDLLDKALEALKAYPLCDSCLGRLFAAMGHGIENKERGMALKTALHMRLVYEYRNGADVVEDLKALARSHEPTRRFLASNGINVEAAACYICGGLLNDVERLAGVAAEALKGVEFETYQVGSIVPKEVLEREREVFTRLGVETGESIKREINRRIGRALRPLLDKRVNKERPDVVVRVDVASGTAEVVKNPVLLMGRYLKLSRAISQGKPVPGARDVLERILDPIRERFGGAELVLHAGGREDVDVRMLGNGRPAVLEIKEPARYKADLSGLSTDVVILSPLRPATRKDVREVKARAKTDIKVYRALALSDRPIAAEDLAKLKELEGAVVVQMTPRRIKRLSPRAKRRRMVYEVAARLVADRVLEILVRCQGGLYVKEFITGDEGRTQPSVAATLGASLEVAELDVLDVEAF